MQAEILKYKNQIEIFENKLFECQDPSVPSERMQKEIIKI